MKNTIFKKIKKSINFLGACIGATLTEVILRWHNYMLLSMLLVLLSVDALNSTVVLPNKFLKETLIEQKTDDKAKSLRKRIIINSVIEVVILFVSLIILADILINDTTKIKLYYIVAPLAVESILLFSFLKFFEKLTLKKKAKPGNKITLKS